MAKTLKITKTKAKQKYELLNEAVKTTHMD